jgi:diphthamide biosynthesis protein 4
MAYTNDYYNILGLGAPSLGSNHQMTSTADLRRAYKLALLAAHPDKKTSGANGSSARACTVDEVKEAYTVLADQKSKAEYDNWLMRNPGAVQSQSQRGGQIQPPSSDFVLGLELLDLSDFDVLDPNHTFSQDMDAGGAGNEEAQMEWTRACRCGDEKGFRILEEELGDAEMRGEKEVLVGCEGCSLWVRVGFEVEEG